MRLNGFHVCPRSWVMDVGSGWPSPARLFASANRLRRLRAGCGDRMRETRRRNGVRSGRCSTQRHRRLRKLAMNRSTAPSPAPAARVPRRRGRRVRADARSPPTPARRAAPRPSRRWSSSTPRRAATPARRPTAGCRSSRPSPAWSPSPSTSTTGTGSAGRTASPAPPSPPRQAEQQASNGARFSYTPQVVVDGQDRKDWPGIAMPLGNRPAGAGRRAAGARGRPGHRDRRRRRRAHRSGWPPTGRSPSRATSPPSRPARTAARRCSHDYVVRDYQTVPAWSARAGAPQTLASSCRRGADARRIRARSTSSWSMPTAAGRCRR